MATDNDFRDATQRLRTGLTEWGPLGAFLIEQIDQLIAAGVESPEEEVTFHRGRRKRTGKAVLSLRAPSPEELFQLHLQVLNAYLREMPQILSSAESTLRSYGVREILVSTAPDLEIDRAVTSAPWTGPLRDLWPLQLEASERLIHLLSLLRPPEQKSDAIP